VTALNRCGGDIAFPPHLSFDHENLHFLPYYTTEPFSSGRL
jgi:hypothetical protein